MKYEVLSAGTPSSLTEKVNHCIAEGWKPIGSHSVVTERSVNRYAGNTLMDTRHQLEFHQTMIKED